MLLTDADRIRNLLGAYCRLIDAGDFAGVGTLMSRAVLATEDGTPVARGAEQVPKLFSGLVIRYEDGTPRTQHLVLNTTFDEPFDAGTAVARSTYVVLQGLPGEPLAPIATGRYVDTFGRDGAGWHFAERRFGIGLSGDLTRHLTTTLG